MSNETKACGTCGIEFKGPKNKKYCSSKCLPSTQADRYPISILPGIPESTIGAISELLAAADLMRKGYHLYRALSASSFSDLVAVKNGQVLHVEVRSGHYYQKKDGSITLGYPKHSIANKFVLVVTHSDNKVHYIDPLPG